MEPLLVVPLFDFAAATAAGVVPLDVGTSKVVAVAGITAGELLVGTEIVVEFDVVGSC